MGTLMADNSAKTKEAEAAEPQPGMLKKTLGLVMLSV